MTKHLDRTRRLLPLFLGAVTLVGVAVLLGQDALPKLFPAGGHDSLAAFCLAAIAFAYIAFQLAYRPTFVELAKAVLLAAAFLFWAANQLWTKLPQAVLFNDIAIGLFVFDVFLVIAGRPPALEQSSLAERGMYAVDRRDESYRCICCGGRNVDCAEERVSERDKPSFLRASPRSGRASQRGG